MSSARYVLLGTVETETHLKKKPCLFQESPKGSAQCSDFQDPHPKQMFLFCLFSSLAEVLKLYER